jgi:hypothetical protein
LTISEQSLDLAVAVNEDRQDDEKLRFIGGFGDIFVTLGIGLAWMCAVTAALSWLLAEFFTRKRRMALPSIALVLSFVGSAFWPFGFFFVFATALPEALPRKIFSFFPHVIFWLDASSALAATGLAALHYWRFRVPITIAAGAATASTAALAFALALFPDLSLHIRSALVIAFGLAAFLAAMRFDMADPERLTRKTDIAFWLHLLAAPLIVQPLIFGFLGGVANLDTPRALGILAIFLGLGLVAIIIDRRAFLVLALAYAGFALGALIHRSGVQHEIIPATLLALGVFVLAISAFWRPLRYAALRLLPAALTRRLPHPLISKTT